MGDHTLSISLKAKGIGETGMLGVGWGRVKMYEAQVRGKDPGNDQTYAFRI